MQGRIHQLKSSPEVVNAAGGSAASGVEGPQAPEKFEDFVLGKRSKDASIMCHFNQKNTTNSMGQCTHISNMIEY